MKYKARNIKYANSRLNPVEKCHAPANSTSDSISEIYEGPVLLPDTFFDYWLCIFTQPHREKLAFGALCELGLEVYLPVCKKMVIRNGKRVPLKVPLFPRYLFIRADKNNAMLYGAHRQTGVSGFAGKTFGQSFISSLIIDEIKSRECPEGFVGLKSKFLKPGQAVKILDGPFAAIDAIFSDAKDDLRSILLLSLLGKTHKVIVSNANLQFVA